MRRLDLTLKMTGADGSESIEHRTVQIQDHPDAGALHRVFHVLHTELRVTTGDQALPRQNERARLVEILGQAREHRALFRYPQCADDVA